MASTIGTEINGFGPIFSNLLILLANTPRNHALVSDVSYVYSFDCICMGPPWTQLPEKVNGNTFIINNYYSWYYRYFVTINTIFWHGRFLFLLSYFSS